MVTSVTSVTWKLTSVTSVTGFLLQAWVVMVGSGARAIGLELDPSTVAAAQQRVGSPVAIDSRIPYPQGSDISVHVADALAPNPAALGLQGGPAGYTGYIGYIGHIGYIGYIGDKTDSSPRSSVTSVTSVTSVKFVTRLDSSPRSRLASCLTPPIATPSRGRGRCDQRWLGRRWPERARRSDALAAGTCSITTCS